MEKVRVGDTVLYRTNRHPSPAHDYDRTFPAIVCELSTFTDSDSITARLYVLDHCDGPEFVFDAFMDSLDERDDMARGRWRPRT